VNIEGALVREDCEIEGSRIAMLASLGSECVAFERRQTQNGVTRFRTPHGWMSEHRRESQREVIVEVLEILNQEQVDKMKIDVSRSQEPCPHKLNELYTMREASSYALSRALASLKTVVVLLSRATVSNDNNTFPRPNDVGSLSNIAPMLATSLSKVFGSYVSYPLSNLDSGGSPRSLSEFKTSQCDTSSYSSKGTFRYLNFCFEFLYHLDHLT
jgi:hypothetical protein